MKKWRAKPVLSPSILDCRYQLLPFCNDVQILTILKDSTAYLYQLREIFTAPDFHGRGFRLDRIRDDLEKDSISPFEATHYNVIIGEHPIWHRCDCVGFESSNSNVCKHVIVMENVLLDEKEKNHADVSRG